MPKNKKKYKWEMKRYEEMKVNLPRNGEYRMCAC